MAGTYPSINDRDFDLYKKITNNTALIADNGAGGTGVTSLTAGLGITISAATGAVTVTNSGVRSAVAGTGISVSGATGTVTFTNTGVTSIVAGSGISISGSTGAVTITATNGGVTSIAGTANQITASASTGAVTLSLPSAVTLPGTLALTTTNSIAFAAGGASISASGNLTTSNLVITPPSAGATSIATGNLLLSSNSAQIQWPGLGNAIYAGSGGATQFIGSPSPSSDALTYSLGLSTLRWNNLYLGGTAFLNKTALGTTSTTGLQLANTTASTSGVPVQYSPRVLFTSHAWNTTATAADNYLEAINELRPTSAATPTSTLAWGFRRSTDGATGSFTDAMTLSDVGRLTTTNDIRVQLTSDSDGKGIEFYNTQMRYRIENSNSALIFRDYQNTAIAQMLVQGQGFITSGYLSGTYVKHSAYTVATLPAAATAGAGSIAYVTDANATTRLSTVAGGGSNKVMVYSDGTNWLIL